mmetsp:Transcript_87535/g.138233  ORF Transcript_87535/g.138233 Transcript_87535/m.138233 type:complete len:628 (-) Transcript_87535:11-1894(-)
MANACREAEAVIDEVALLESALREALERKQNMLPQPMTRHEAPPTATLGLDTNLDGRVDTYVTGVDQNRDGIPDVLQKLPGRRLPETPSTLEGARYGVGSVKTLESFDAATASYGVQLRSWINWQVDHRLEEVMQDVIQKQISQVHEESGLSLGLAKRAEAESERNKETLAKLFAVVDGMSRELERFNAQTNETNTVINLIQMTVEKLKEGRIDEAEVRGELERMRRQIEPLEKEVTPGLLLAVQRDIRELAMKTEDNDNRVECSLAALHSEILAKLAEESRNVESLRQTGMLQYRELQDVEARLGNLGESFSVLNRKCDAATLNGQLEEWLSEVRQDVEASHKKLVADLRAETTAAFRSQSASFAALDEQVWLTDQRLGQRIDEVAQASKLVPYSSQFAHERPLAGSSRTMSRDGSRSCLNDTDEKVKVDVHVAQKPGSPRLFQFRSRRLPEAPSPQEPSSLRVLPARDRTDSPQNNGPLLREYLSVKPQAEEPKIDRQAESVDQSDGKLRGRLRFGGSTTPTVASDSSLGRRRLIVSREDSRKRLLLDNSTDATPMAMVGLDTNLDGRVDTYVAGADRNRDGIPDVLQGQKVDLGSRRGEGLQLSTDEPHSLGRSSSLRSLRSLR